jgi:hypothetical protein
MKLLFFNFMFLTKKMLSEIINFLLKIQKVFQLRKEKHFSL